MKTIGGSLPADLLASINNAKKACTERAKRDYEKAKLRKRRDGGGHPMGNRTDKEKRDLYQQALRGENNLDGPWQRFALREDVEIGVWLYFYQRRALPPADKECAAAWGGECPPKLRPVPKGGKPLPKPIETDDNIPF